MEAFRLNIFEKAELSCGKVINMESEICITSKIFEKWFQIKANVSEDLFFLVFAEVSGVVRDFFLIFILVSVPLARLFAPLTHQLNP